MDRKGYRSNLVEKPNRDLAGMQNVPQKPRRSILQWIGVVVLLATFVGVMVTYGPSHRTSPGLLHDWFAQRREAQRQREIAAELQHVEQIKRDMEALQLKSKAKSEQAWKEFDKRMQPLATGAAARTD